jgi:hypothetical protein
MSLLAYQVLVFKYILQKDPEKLSPLFEAAFWPYLLCFTGLGNMLPDLMSQKKKWYGIESHIIERSKILQERYTTSFVCFLIMT